MRVEERKAPCSANEKAERISFSDPHLPNSAGLCAWRGHLKMSQQVGSITEEPAIGERHGPEGTSR
jgi:hypothetical protein